MKEFLKNLKNKDVMLGIFMALFALVALHQTRFMPPPRIDSIGPAGFPRALSLILLFFSILIIISGLASKKEEKEFADLNIRKNYLVVITFISLIIYIFLLMPNIGFIFSTIIFLWFLQYTLTPGKKKYINITLISIITPIALNYIFTELLTVFLPGY